MYYYNWSKEFLEAGKKRLQGDTLREANSTEVNGLRHENSQLKELVAELSCHLNLCSKQDVSPELESISPALREKQGNRY